MLYIEKGPEPTELTEYRACKWNSEEQQPVFPSYDNMPTAVKSAVRASLLREQGYLCAYCMRRITEENVRIEHWQAERELDDSGKLNYGNMLGVCPGKVLASPDADNANALSGHLSETCDRHRGHTPLHVNPRSRLNMERIAYHFGNGRIYSTDEQIDIDINNTLNLNCGRPHFLPQNRKKVLEEIVKRLNRRNFDKQWRICELNKLKNHYEARNARGELPEYAGVALWYINSRLKRAGA